MKVLVLGGYGKVGLPVAKLLAQSDLVTEVAVAGRNLERAQEAATQIGPKAIAVQADGLDEGALAAVLAGYDVVANAASVKSGLPTVRAAAQAGVHYCDVTSFGDSCDEMVELSPEAQAAGITAVIANGISPNLSNLMGVHVARQLDQVEQIQSGRAGIYNFGSGHGLTPRQWTKAPEESLAALDEFKGYITWRLQILQENGVQTVLDYKDGRWVETDPLQNGTDVPHLAGGTTTAYPYMTCSSFWGTLPRDLATHPPVELWFTTFPPQTDAMLCKRAQAMLQDKTTPEAVVDAFYDTIAGDPHRWLTSPDDVSTASEMWIRAVGHKQGRAARYTCWFTAPMWDVTGYYLTSVALVVAALKILRGEVEERGVMTAESVFDPLPFLDEVASLLPGLEGEMIDESFDWLE